MRRFQPCCIIPFIREQNLLHRVVKADTEISTFILRVRQRSERSEQVSEVRVCLCVLLCKLLCREIKQNMFPKKLE